MGEADSSSSLFQFRRKVLTRKRTISSTLFPTHLKTGSEPDRKMEQASGRAFVTTLENMTPEGKESPGSSHNTVGRSEDQDTGDSIFKFKLRAEKYI